MGHEEHEGNRGRGQGLAGGRMEGAGGRMDGAGGVEEGAECGSGGLWTEHAVG